MVYTLVLAFLMISTVSQPALCCEGDCQTGITAAFIEKYSKPIHSVFSQLAAEISQNFSLSVQDPLHLLEPINSTFYHTAHDFLKHAIFPSYFHGKCQNPTTGIDPPGCPNPSCPVVCGTPGSLVFHYSVLRTIVHTATKVNYQQAANPGSLAFSETLSRVLRAGDSKRTSRLSLRFARNIGIYGKHNVNLANQTLSSILRGFSDLLDAQCSGSQRKPGSSLPLCDWRDDMIPYILSFP